MSIAVIINPISGGARHRPVAARAALAAATAKRLGEAAAIFVTERVGHARELALAAAAAGARLIVAWGGDGTINEVASALAFGEIPLGIIAAGSGNGLARELGIDAAPERALERAILAKPAAIDLGEIGGRLFVNIAGIGIDAYVAAQFNAVGNTGRGFTGYLRAGLRALVSYVPIDYTIATDREHITARAVIVVLANAVQYGNGARIAPGARIDDGLLDLVIIEERSRLATLWRTPHLFRGTLASVPGCSIRRVRHATIESAAPMIFHVDGESVADPSLRLAARVHPGALKLCTV